MLLWWAHSFPTNNVLTEAFLTRPSIDWGGSAAFRTMLCKKYFCCLKRVRYHTVTRKSNKLFERRKNPFKSHCIEAIERENVLQKLIKKKQIEEINIKMFNECAKDTAKLYVQFFTPK